MDGCYPMIEVLTLTPECGPETCELLPVWSGRHFRQYELRDDQPPLGYVESCLYCVFLLWKEGRSRPTTRSIYLTTELDTAADAWLWNPPGTPDKAYSSRPAFTAWYRDVVREMQAKTLSPQGLLWP